MSSSITSHLGARFLFCLSVGVSVRMHSHTHSCTTMHVCADVRAIVRCPHQSLSTFTVETDLSAKPGLSQVQLCCLSGNLGHLPLSASLAMGLQVCATMLWFLRAGDPKSGLHACIESILPTEPFSQIQRAVSERTFHCILTGLHLQEGFVWLHPG